MAKSAVMSNMKFKLKHIGHRITTGSSSVGQVFICSDCDIVNTTQEQEEGRASNFKSFDEWREYHERHGTVCNYGGGTMEFYCSKCHSDW